MASQTYNILMYSHDTYGLGHIRRTMAIATHLLNKDVNVLIITGSPIVGRFIFPEGVDFVRVPGMIKRTNTLYVPHSININAQHALHIRRSIITATAKAFDPKLVIVDKVPLGLKGELLPTLKWFRKTRPETRIILGLRDILDDAETTREEWERKNFAKVLENLYSEIWIYGIREMYDPITEYAIPSSISQKTVFTGYIPRHAPRIKKNSTAKKRHVLVTIGGGGDGYPVLDTYLTMLEQNPDLPFKSRIIAGPFITRDMHDQLAYRAKQVGARFDTFVKKIEKQMALADLVVSMGGYNTVCEILSQKKISLIIPRESPRREQLIRAEILKKHGLADFIPWNRLAPDLMLERIQALLHNQQGIQQALRDFPMTGLEVMRSRLETFRREDS